MSSEVSASADEQTPDADEIPKGAEFQDIPSLYNRLHVNFRDVLIALNGNPMAVDSAALEVAHEEFTRLKIWGVQSRASVSGIHGLLDLEEQPEIGNLLIDVLKEANDCLLRILPRAATCDAASLEFLEDSDSDSSSSSSETDEAPSADVAMSFKMVFENINELYRLKTLLQKPRLKGRYLHSRRSYRNLPGYQQDYQHVRQKIDFWRTEPSGDPDEEEATEDHETHNIAEEALEKPGISMDEVIERQDAEDASLHDIDDLCRRLAAANSKRRKQLWYWESHPYLDGAGKLLEMEAPKPFQKTDPIGLTTNDADSYKPPTTAHTFSTAARSAIFPESRDRNDQEEAGTVYEPSVIGGPGRSKLRIPDAPLAAEGENTIECPYCHMILSIDKISNRVSWKRHVFRDLRPYVCTIEGCSDPDRQFVTRYDWTYHESQVHHRRWDCGDCDQAFEDKEAFILHMSDEHSGRWTKRQISLLGELREHGKDDTERLSCRLCLASLQKQSYFRHVAAHLEEISLFALPKLVSEGEEEANSTKANENNAIRSLEYNLSDEASEESPDLNEAKQVEVVQGLTQKWGRKHPETLQSMEKLASIYYKHERWRDSEQLQAEIWESRKELLGLKHLDTLRSMNNLVWTLVKQERYTEAEKLQVELVELHEEVLGSEHIDTLRSQHMLARTLAEHDQWEEAERLWTATMETSKEVLGLEHPDTLLLLEGLTWTFKNQNRLEEAEELEVEVAELRKRVLGPDHPDTLRSMYNLSLTLSQQERWEEAEKLQVEVTEFRKEVLGPNHPDTLRGMVNLAFTLSRQRRWEEAEELQVEVTELRKEVLGRDHPNTLSSMVNLATTWKNQGRHMEAIGLLQECVERSRATLGADHKDYLEYLERLNVWAEEQTDDSTAHV